jgi:hypothetical protein
MSGGFCVKSYLLTTFLIANSATGAHIKPIILVMLNLPLSSKDLFLISLLVLAG